MELRIEQGRPQDETGRLPKEIRCYDLLDLLGIPFRRIDHEALYTMEACEEVDGAAGVVMCKNLFLCNRQKTDFYLLLMPGDKPFKTKELSGQIGSARLSFADAEYMERFLDITPGSVSVLGLMNDREHRVRLLIDEDVLNAGEFGCHPCVNTSSLCMKTSDMVDKFLPAVDHGYTTVVLTGEA